MKPTIVAPGATAKATAVAILALISSYNAGAANKYSVLYNFCSQANCADNADPATIFSDGTGHLFGTAYPGGSSNLGAIFELARNRGGGFSETVIYSFCSLENCTDGSLPGGSLIRDTSGNFYGVTSEGGTFDRGEVYELTHRHGAWGLEVLYSFCSQSNCNDGKFPYAGLAWAGSAHGAAFDGTSPLYGTNNSGGANGWGTVFELRRGRDGWSEKTLYSFCALSGCGDGASPAATLTVDVSGNVYGTTDSGGQGEEGGSGVLFELKRSGGGWDETVLHAFCGADSCADGATPGGLTMDASGTLYGTTFRGGFSCIDRDFGPCGLVYSLVPAGVNSPYTILYTFGQDGRGDDGANPVGTPILDASGDLFGVTDFGGAGGNGVAWKLTGSKLKVLHTFCSSLGDGCDPSSLYRDERGRLFGTTSGGGTGTDSHGTAFEIRR